MVLVTGGTGFIGRALLPELVKRGHRVCVLTRNPASVVEHKRGVEIRRGDVLDPASLSSALVGVTTVVHLAAALPDSGLTPDLIRRTNVDGTANLARAVSENHRVVQFVHGSSAGVYGDGITPGLRDESTAVAPTTLYEWTKLDAERAVAERLSGSSVSWVILRPSGVHGPGRLSTARFYRQVCRRPLWIHGPATVMVHPTFVQDVVAAVALTVGRLELHGEVLNIAGPRAMTYPELVELLADRLGVRVHQLRLPNQPIRATACRILRMSRQLGASPAFIARLTRTFVNRTVDTSKAKRILGFSPLPIEVGIDETIAWARREGLL
jgi:nucleoside-diphosphate-sugar epimerase